MSDDGEFYEALERRSKWMNDSVRNSEFGKGWRSAAEEFKQILYIAREKFPRFEGSKTNEERVNFVFEIADWFYEYFGAKTPKPKYSITFKNGRNVEFFDGQMDKVWESIMQLDCMTKTSVFDILGIKEIERFTEED